MSFRAQVVRLALDLVDLSNDFLLDELHGLYFGLDLRFLLFLLFHVLEFYLNILELRLILGVLVLQQREVSAQLLQLCKLTLAAVGRR